MPLTLRFYQPDTSHSCYLPLFMSKVAAGFPSPATDFIEKTLDLNEFLVKHPAATFFVRVEGESMMGSHIYPGDILVVDRSLTPTSNSIIIAVLNGELTVKRIKKDGKRLWILPENPEFEAMVVSPEMDFSVWGVVTHVIHKT